jgi:NADPH:quinone reductase-like Zn-dependent oxidoreductase
MSNVMNKDAAGTVIEVGDIVSYTGVVKEITKSGGISTLSVEHDNKLEGPGAAGRELLSVPAAACVKVVAPDALAVPAEKHEKPEKHEKHEKPEKRDWSIVG